MGMPQNNSINGHSTLFLLFWSHHFLGSSKTEEGSCALPVLLIQNIPENYVPKGSWRWCQRFAATGFLSVFNYIRAFLDTPIEANSLYYFFVSFQSFCCCRMTGLLPTTAGILSALTHSWWGWFTFHSSVFVHMQRWCWFSHCLKGFPGWKEEDRALCPYGTANLSDTQEPETTVILGMS